MTSFGNPGQYVQESPAAMHPIFGAGTSEAAFVDFFARGPLNQAVRITSAADFNEIFGGPRRSN
jgi:uncharacterized protein